jgi:hypothetical protein
MENETYALAFQVTLHEYHVASLPAHLSHVKNFPGERDD